jgi:CxxC-x17-CxxC domain-containing protein
MEFTDRTLNCLDCKNEFVFTAGEQAFYERKGFREIPKRCKPCRDARKARRPQRDEGYSNGNGNGNGHNGECPYGEADGNSRSAAPRERGPREMFDATCASCGGPARVPFRPASGRPVYCRDCYGTRQGQGSAYGSDE